MLEDLKPNQRNFTCKIVTIANTLETTDREIFNNMVNGDEWTAVGLSRALASKGIQISGHTIGTHRNKGCSCWKN